MATSAAVSVQQQSLFARLRHARSLRGAGKIILRRFGYDIRQIGGHLDRRPIDFIRSRNVDLVIDVGANIGQYAESLRHDGYDGRIVSFEPTSVAYKALAAGASKNHDWLTMHMALGQEDGTAEIGVSEASDFSSFLPQRPKAQDLYPAARVLGYEQVRVSRLDGLLAEFPRARAPFLKIDTQGFERPILLGASGCLSDFVGIQLELPIIHLYEGTWDFGGAIAFMKERGFVISNITPVGYDISDPVSSLEFDCIFRRRREND